MTVAAVLGYPRLGNFRLGYISAALAAVRETRVVITVDGEVVCYRLGSVVIHDVANDSPNTAELSYAADTRPEPQQIVRISINADAPRLLFNGALESVEETYQGKPEFLVYHCTAQDDTPQANRRIPLARHTSVSATTVGQSLVADFCPGFTATHVEAGLPAITALFDGSEAGVNGCLRQVAKLIGGYFYWEDRDLHLFQTEASEQPDDIDSSTDRFLNTPHIHATRDDSQLRTRVYGKGHAEQTQAETASGADTIPVGDVSMYQTGGGQVISEELVLTYTGVVTGNTGSTVAGSALSPGAPSASVVFGTAGRIGVGAYQYKVSFVLPAGESDAGTASGSVSIADVSAPSAPSGSQTLSVSGNLSVGTYLYKITYETLAGETTGGSASSGIAIADISAPSAPSGSVVSGTPGNLLTGTYKYKATYLTAAGETTASSASGDVTVATVTAPSAPTGAGATAAGGAMALGNYIYSVTYLTERGETTTGSTSATITLSGAHTAATITLPTSSDTRVIGRRLYRSDNASGGGSRRLVVTLQDNTTTAYTDITPDATRGTVIPGSDTSGSGQITVTVPTSGDSRVTKRSLYRTEVGGSTYLFLTTLNDNSDTSFLDNIPDSSLGGTPPGTSTAATGKITLTIPASGDARVTGRGLYRTAVGGSEYKRIATVPDNSTTSYSDNVADDARGTAPPTVNDAGTGQIAVSSIPLGPTGTTSRRIYRTESSGTTYKHVRTIGDNSTTSFTDNASDGSLGETAPLLSGIGALAGATALRVADLAQFPVNGWVLVGGQLLRFTGRSGTSGEGTLTIPGSGVGSIGAGIAASVSVVNQPHLTGISGVTRVLIKGSALHIWVQEDDAAAQAALAARDGSDGIIEHRIVDERRGEASLRALCQADLALYSRSLVTVKYASRDVKTKSGKPIVVNLTSPAISETLTIQEVTIDQIGLAPGLAPRFTVMASSVRFSLEDLLRRMASTSLEGN